MAETTNKRYTTLQFAASDNLWIRARQADVIERRLDAHKEDFHVFSINYYEKGLLTFTIYIKGDPSMIWNERKIANMINSYNPTGYYLALKSSATRTVEEVKEKVKEGVEATTEVVKHGLHIGIKIALAAALIYWLYKSHTDPEWAIAGDSD